MKCEITVAGFLSPRTAGTRAVLTELRRRAPLGATSRTWPVPSAQLAIIDEAVAFVLTR